MPLQPGTADARDGPPPGCGLCPRLAAFRASNRAAFPDWHNAPVASFGDPAAALLVVGLAPGLRGANRTARPFTGDYAGDLLYDTLARFGFSTGRYGADAADGLTLDGCRITNAVRCVPPENKPTGAEVKTCLGFLKAELTAAPAPRVVLALGTLAHGAVLAALGRTRSRFAFGHNVVHALDGGPVLVDSYHCSRYNTNTGKLTPAMFDDAFRSVRTALDRSSPRS